MGRRGKRARSSKSETKLGSKSLHSTIPNPESKQNSDEIRLKTILPEEVWLIILENKIRVNTENATESMTNCSLASPYFRNLLAIQITFFLFPRVFETLATWIENDETNLVTNDNSSNSDDNDILEDSDDSNDSDNPEDSNNPKDKIEKPTILSVIKLTDILKCREVCSWWNKAFEDFYQSSQRYTVMKHDPVKLPRNLGVVTMDMRDDNIERHPSSFLRHFEKSHGDGGDELPTRLNPFPGRSLTLNQMYMAPVGTYDPEFEAIREETTTILGNYGNNLWHCNMDLLDHNFARRINFYNQFKQWLSLMPNLKTFQVNCVHITNRLGNFQGELDAMQGNIARNPLPQLTSLKYLSVTSLTSVIFNELIRSSGQQLTHLVISRRNEWDHVDYEIHSEAHLLPQLKELSINFASVRQFGRMESSVVASNWKLEKFYFLYDDHVDVVDWSRVFQMISNKWSDSLNNLVLQMPIPKTDSEKVLCLEASLASTVLQLSNLTRVKLIVKVPCSLDFLLPMASTLKRIEVIADYEVNKEKVKRYYRLLKRQQRVKFLGYEDNKEMFTSNILEMFPNLICLQIVTPLNDKKASENYGFKCWYRFCLYKSGVMSSEDRLEYPWLMPLCGLIN